MPRSAANDLFVAWPGSREVLTLLADKWTIPVMHALGRSPHRTGELRRALTGVSQKMLTQTLRRLEDAGMITREVFATVPPKVEYALTPLGRSLNGPLTALCEWVDKHGPKLAARKPTRRRAA